MKTIYKDKFVRIRIDTENIGPDEQGHILIEPVENKKAAIRVYPCPTRLRITAPKGTMSPWAVEIENRMESAFIVSGPSKKSRKRKF